MLLSDLVDTWSEVRNTRSRTDKIGLLADRLGQLAPEEIEIGVSFLAGEPRQGRLGVGYRTVYDVRAAPAGRPSLTLLKVDEAFWELIDIVGPGSKAKRAALLEQLMGSATPAEQEFLRGLMLHELRQGALEGVMAEALAQVADVPSASVRRALMLSGRLTDVGAAALRDGEEGLASFRLTLFRPVKPMLAATAASVEEAIDKVGEASVEVKFDGARVQVHREGAEVRIYTRNLRDITSSLPGLAEAAGGLDVSSVILDGEAMTFLPDGRPMPFQQTMSQFSQQETDAGSRALVAFFFDCLHLDGHDLIDRSGSERFGALTSVVPSDMVVPRIVTADRDEGAGFYDQALERGHEGVMVKALGAPYAAGRRGSAWLKVKPAHTLDLVVLAAEWGSGRRQGWLSNLHLGARDPTSGDFVMLGKTFKGLTDEMLEWQTKRFLELERDRDPRTVYLRPEQVVEVAFDGIQTSTRYPGGMALRFARVKQYRSDKSADEADTIDTVRAIWEGKRQT